MSVTKYFNYLYDYQYQKTWRVVFWLNASLLLYLTLSPVHNVGISINHADKLFHFIGFGAFTFLLYLGYPSLKILKMLGISFSLGIAVELAQSIIPYRSFDLVDMVADFLGSTTAVLVLSAIKKIHPKNRPQTEKEPNTRA